MFSFNIASSFFFEKIDHSVVNAHKQLFRTQGVGWGLLET